MTKTRTQLIGVAYARVSSKEQEAEGFSIDSQIRLLRQYAKERGIVLEHVFVEAETAKRAGRKAFGEMVRFLAHNPGRLILVEKVDRLYRNFADYVKVDALGVELHFVKDGMVVSESSRSQDKFMHGIRVLMAKNYVDNLSEEIRKGLDEKAAQGIYPTHAPLGYLNSFKPGTRRKVIVPDPARAGLVREVFQLYATGSVSLEGLTKHARQIGLTSKKGQRLPKSALAQLLKHPAYCGLIRWGGKEMVGVHAPLVGKEVWEKCQMVMQGRKNNNGGYGVKEFAYRGLIRCKCGGVMTGELKQGRFVYYHCAGRHKHLCGQPYVKEEEIDASFENMLAGLKLPQRELEWVRSAFRDSDRDRSRSRETRERAISVELTELKQKLETLYLDKVAGEVSQQFYAETRRKWEDRITELELEVAALDRAETVSVDHVMAALELASGASDRFKEADSVGKRGLLEFVCSNCSWEDGELVVELHNAFVLMLKTLDALRQDDGTLCRIKTKTVDWWR